VQRKHQLSGYVVLILPNERFIREERSNLIPDVLEEMLGDTRDKTEFAFVFKILFCGYHEKLAVNYYPDRYCDHLAGPVIFVALVVLITKFGSSDHLQYLFNSIHFRFFFIMGCSLLIHVFFYLWCYTNWDY
jgi:hypothetical protein